jgi:hypothetical protein
MIKNPTIPFLPNEIIIGDFFFFLLFSDSKYLKGKDKHVDLSWLESVLAHIGLGTLAVFFSKSVLSMSFK